MRAQTKSKRNRLLGRVQFAALTALALIALSEFRAAAAPPTITPPNQHALFDRPRVYPIPKIEARLTDSGRMMFFANLSVCAASCTYNNSQLPDALAAAAPGDSILTQENFSYVGSFVLPAKTCPANDASCFIDLRTGVTSAGVALPEGDFPAANIRITPAYSSKLSKLVVNTNNVPALTTATSAKWWKIRRLEFRPNTWGGDALLRIGDESQGPLRSTMPEHFIVDQVYLKGDAATGQFRGMSIHGNDVTLSNSYAEDIKSVFEGQVVWVNSADHDIFLINNYLSGGTETFFTGGSGSCCTPGTTILASPAPTTTSATVSNTLNLFVGMSIRIYAGGYQTRTLASCGTSTPGAACTTTALTWSVATSAAPDTPGWIAWDITVLPSPSPTTTSATLSGTPDLRVGHGLTMKVGGVEQYTEIVSCGTSTAEAVCTSNAITFSPPLSAAPDTPGDANWNVVTRNFELRLNHFTRPLSWRTNAIAGTPGNVVATGSGTGGTLAADTYAYKVVARQLTNRGVTVRSTASTQSNSVTTTGTTSSVTTTWNAVTNASEYYVYGRTPGGQTMRWTVPAGTHTFTDTGAAGTVENVPTDMGDRWLVKNTVEFKQGYQILVEGNIIENSWVHGQAGPLFVLTGTTQSGENDSVHVSHVTARYNIIRNGAQPIQLSGRDANNFESGRAGPFNFHDLLIYDIGGVYGSAYIVSVTNGGSTRQSPTKCPENLTLNHITFHAAGHSGAGVLDCYADGVYQTIPSMIITNLITYVGEYGFGSTGAGGYTQGAITPVQGAGSTWDKVLIAGAFCGAYPAGTQCPSIVDLETNTFTNVATRDFTVKSSSVYYNAGTDGKSYGADISLITPLTDIALSGNNSGAAPALSIPTTSPLPSGVVKQAYAATISCTGGTAPRTFSIAPGSLQPPPGLTLNSAGSLAGTPTTSSLRTITVRCTDATAAFVDKTFSVSITLALVRERRYNWTEGAFFIRPVCPSGVSEQVLEGDVCWDTTNKLFRQATSVSPLTWSTIGASGGSTGGAGIQSILVYSGPAFAHTNLTGDTEIVGMHHHRFRLDAQNSTQIAAFANFTSLCASGGRLKFQYWSGSAWSDSGAEVACDAGNLIEGTFATLATGARAQNVVFRGYLTGGNGIADPAFTNIRAQFR